MFGEFLCVGVSGQRANCRNVIGDRPAVGRTGVHVVGRR